MNWKNAKKAIIALDQRAEHEGRRWAWQVKINSLQEIMARWAWVFIIHGPGRTIPEYAPGWMAKEVIRAYNRSA